MEKVVEILLGLAQIYGSFEVPKAKKAVKNTAAAKTTKKAKTAAKTSAKKTVRKSSAKKSK